MDSILLELSDTRDSLRTPEQKETLKRIQLMIAKYVELNDGVYSFTLSKEEFVKKAGLGIEYYDFMIKNIDDTNSMADVMDFREAEESFYRMTERVLEENQ